LLGEHNGWERQMSYLTKVANERPMIRVSGEILLAFCFAAPLLLALSFLV
jgi:hypothetical protein